MRLALLFLTSALAYAQPTGIVDASRVTDWSQAGTTIQTRTNICQTLSPGATYTQINTAIQNCAEGSVVKLNAGNYTIGGGITFNGKNNVTLRGAGPDQTKLTFNANGGCVYNTLICVVSSSSINPEAPSRSATWSAGYSAGTTSITISQHADLYVGSVIYLDQLNDASDTYPEVFQCAAGGTCAIEGDSGINRAGRTQVEVKIVTSCGVSTPGAACTSNTIGIDPPLIMPNWRSGKTPQAWWMNGGYTGIGNGIEDLSVANNGLQDGSNISFGNVHSGWIKNVRSLNGERSHVLLYGTTKITIRDSYFYGTLNATTRSYGIETDIASSFLVENTISHHLTSYMTMGQAAVGSAWLYNFSIDSYYCAPDGSPADWMQGSSYHHTSGIAYTLFEGNVGTGFIADAIHGTANFMTGFRNRWQGYDPAGCSVSGKTVQTIPVHVYAFNRFFNLVGNVLGDVRRGHDTYENYVTSTTLPASAANPDVSIYMLGFSGNQEKATTQYYDFAVNNDVRVRDTLMRWGNWDTVNQAARWVSGEVPSGLSQYANAVPSSQTLSASFVYGSRPAAWWRTPWGTPAWPPIGPDVTGGNIADVGGKAHKIPAQLCYENTGQTGGILDFNAGNCYQSTGDLTPRNKPAGRGSVAGAGKVN